MDKIHEQTCHQRVYTVASKHLQRCSASLVTREIQIKTTGYKYTPIRMPKLKNKQNIIPSVGEGGEKLELLWIAGGSAK